MTPEETQDAGPAPILQVRPGEDTAEALARTVKQWLAEAKISPVASIGRMKSARSIAEKRLAKPGHEIEDRIGVRVLAHVRSDIEVIERVIRDHLWVDDATYINKASALGSAEFGYRSVQFVVKLAHPADEIYSTMDQWKAFEWADKAEIQIRTVLEHAWAELDHLVYKHRSLGNAVTRRTFAITAALLEQADNHLDDLHGIMTGQVPAPIVPSALQLRLSPKRFIETNVESLAADKRITAALDLPFGRIEKYLREVEWACSAAGWETEDDAARAVDKHGEMALRAAIACAPVDRYMLIPDSLSYRGQEARAFPGIALYWVALVVAFGIDGKPTRGEGAPTIGIVAGRLEEWAQVIQYLIDHPEESALAVRARYQAAAAPAYADRRVFRSIEAHLEAPSGGALG